MEIRFKLIAANLIYVLIYFAKFIPGIILSLFHAFKHFEYFFQLYHSFKGIELLTKISYFGYVL